MHHHLEIYADGGTRNNGSPEAIGGWGWVILYQGEKVREGKGSSLLLDTNNKNEIYAVTEALRNIQPRFGPEDTVSIEAFLDATYVIDFVEKKLFVKYRKNNWMLKENQPVKNQEWWSRLLSELDRLERSPWKISVSFRKVKGHSGDTWNEYVDRLANEAMDNHRFARVEIPALEQDEFRLPV